MSRNNTPSTLKEGSEDPNDYSCITLSFIFDDAIVTSGYQINGLINYINYCDVFNYKLIIN